MFSKLTKSVASSAKAGAAVVDSLDVPAADLMLRVGPPTLDEIRAMSANATIVGFLDPFVREDLLGHAAPQTPVLLNYEQCAKDNSLTNTANTFAVYVTGLVLEWLQEQGGVEAIEKVNEQKAKVLYDIIDAGGYYRGVIQPECRGTMNVSFNLPSEELEAKFLKEAGALGLYALKGHRSVGGMRASIYNAMPLAGVRALVDFMADFERRHG